MGLALLFDMFTAVGSTGFFIASGTLLVGSGYSAYKTYDHWAKIKQDDRVSNDYFDEESDE
jgi:hypothetical protein